MWRQVNIKGHTSAKFKSASILHLQCVLLRPNYILHFSSGYEQNKKQQQQQPTTVTHITSHILFVIVCLLVCFHIQSLAQQELYAESRLAVCFLSTKRQQMSLSCFLFVCSVFLWSARISCVWKNVCEISNLHCRIVYCKPPVVQPKQCDTWK